MAMYQIDINHYNNKLNIEMILIHNLVTILWLLVKLLNHFYFQILMFYKCFFMVHISLVYFADSYVFRLLFAGFFAVGNIISYSLLNQNSYQCACDCLMCMYVIGLGSM